MRYENPLYMAEEAAAADLISDGRLQLGISRGSPEPALRGAESFGYVPPEGDRRGLRAGTRALFRAAISGAGVARADPGDDGFDGAAGDPAAVAGPGRPDLVGLGHPRDRGVGGEQGMNLMSSTLLSEDTGVPFDDLQAEQIALFRSAWPEAGWEREPRVSVSRSVIPITTDLDRMYFGDARACRRATRSATSTAGIARFGRSYIGEPDVIAEELARDAAVREADTLLLTVPEPARRRVQRAPARDDRRARRPGRRLAPRPASLTRVQRH